MMEILENQTLEMFNVLSFRGKITQQELEAKSKEIEQIIQKAGASKTGPSVSTTYSVEMGSTSPLLDVELLIPLDSIIEIPEGYTIKNHFLLQHAIKVIHRDVPARLDMTIRELNQFIVNHSFVPVTSLYTITPRTINNTSKANDMEVEIYVGVIANENLL